MMSDDRELIALAAKAANIHIEYFNETSSGAWVPEDYDDNQHGPFVEWNPLTDDGDALRLAVNLRLEINPFASEILVSHSTPGGVCVSERNDEPYSSTRRAIVRAAAKIGAAK
jgi:hypothetical protein